MPWATKILYPMEKWLPIHVAPESDPKAATPSEPAWQVISSPPTNEAAEPPPGVPVYWWKHPKSSWPYATPWAKKQFGVLPPMQTWMMENHTDHFPPLGIIKVNMYDTKTPIGQQIAFQKIRMHMRHLSPDEMSLKMAQMPFGIRYYARGMAWDQYTGTSEYIEVKSREIKWNYPGEHPFTKTSSAATKEPPKDLFT